MGKCTRENDVLQGMCTFTHIDVMSLSLPHRDVAHNPSGQGIKGRCSQARRADWCHGNTLQGTSIDHVSTRH